MELAKYMDKLRQSKPLVHYITNYVTVNDCANACLAIGGSPVMADAVDEVEDMTTISSSLVVNIGTLNAAKVDTMIKAGKRANGHHVPVIFDPVGCGATPFRNQMAEKILKQVHMAVIRGNASEILALGGKRVHTKGVDAGDTADWDKVALLAEELSKMWGSVVVISGASDIVTDGVKTVLIHNGCPEMSIITGSGCMCTSLIGAFCGANPDEIYESTVAAMSAMGVAGEKAWELYGNQGLGHFHMGMIDELGKMTGTDLDKGADYEEY